MRTIKFRAWNEAHKMMSVAFSLRDVLFGRTQGANFHGSELMQFTGLLDKNGKEIYEGDIVREVYKEERLYQVRFTNARFGLHLIKAEKGRPTYRPLDIASHPCEVIGNIYENPELLTLN
jgi:uncharacterized phage protein (TIGR01671 family)